MKDKPAWTPGYRNVVDAEIAYEALEAIRKETGELDPAEIVKRARAKSHPLHAEIYREGDSAAARMWRMDRARCMARSLVIVRKEVPKAAGRAYEITYAKDQADAGPTRNVYQRTEDILRDPVQRDILLTRAIREAIAFRKRYGMLQELAQVVQAVDEFLTTTDCVAS